jgi:PIN domain nuclease of toxin-antitoxin system
MNLLLDTHSFIWFIDGSENLSATARREIENPMNKVFVSIASLWEIAIKTSIKKLSLKNSFSNVFKLIEKNGFTIMPVEFSHTKIVSKLKYFHRDPFDRMLIAQAKSEKMTIVGKDELFDKYKVKRIW